MEQKRLDIIGSTEYISVAGIPNVPAKIDTGADSSAIWASHIHVTEDGVLRFRLFDEGSPFYTGEELETTEFSAALVRSSSGHEQIRYRVRLRANIKGKNIKVRFNLSNRSANTFPVLIGRRSIMGKFIVDVSKNNTGMRSARHKTKSIREQLQSDPYKFHLKHFKQTNNNNNDNNN